MKKGTKIIYQGVVCDFDKKIFGVPDLIVRSDELNNLFETEAINEGEQKISAINIGKPYHYVIVDIKNSTIKFNSDFKTIRNDGNIKAFKTQIIIYNNCLGIMQIKFKIFYYVDGWTKKYKLFCKFNRKIK